MLSARRVGILAASDTLGKEGENTKDAFYAEGGGLRTELGDKTDNKSKKVAEGERGVNCLSMKRGMSKKNDPFRAKRQYY